MRVEIKTYITGLLAVLVLTGLIAVGMRAQDVDHVRAAELTGKVERRFKALEHTDRHEHNPTNRTV